MCVCVCVKVLFFKCRTIAMEKKRSRLYSTHVMHNNLCWNRSYYIQKNINKPDIYQDWVWKKMIKQTFERLISIHLVERRDEELDELGHFVWHWTYPTIESVVRNFIEKRLQSRTFHTIDHIKGINYQTSSLILVWSSFIWMITKKTN